MYQTKLKYKRNGDAQRQYECMVNANALHQEMQRMFDCQRNEKSVLYTRQPGTGEAAWYVFSDAAPDVEASDIFEVEYMRSIATYYAPGTKLRFYISCNPTMQKDRKRYFLSDESKREAWLYRKAHDNGFRILAHAETARGKVSVKKDKKGTLRFEFPYVSFAGIVEVTDSEKFEMCLRDGIGSEKAYGMGMLMVV